MLRFNYGALQLTMFALALLALVGCSGGGTPVSLPEPAGAASGKNTFILFYIDN